MRLDLGREIHNDHNNNQQRRTAKIKRYIPVKNQKLGHQAHQRNIGRTGRRQPRHHTIDIPGGLFPRTDAGNKCTGLLQIVRRLPGIEYQRGVEETEKHNCQGIEDHIQRLSRRQGRCNILQPPHAFIVTEPAAHGRRKQDNTGGKYRRYHAGHIQFQRQMGALRGIHLAALLPFGIVDGYPALATLHKHHERGHRQHQCKQHQDRHDIHFTGTRQFQRTTDGGWQPGDNTGQDDDRDTVTHTAFGHLFAQPHQKDGTRYQGHDGGDDKPRTRV